MYKLAAVGFIGFIISTVYCVMKAAGDYDQQEEARMRKAREEKE